MIFVDSNIPMYIVGAEHPNKHAAQRILEAAIKRGERLVTSAEVLQEILHRYGAIRQPDAIEPAFRVLLGVVDEVYPVTARDVRDAKDLMGGLARLSAREALHVAVMRQQKIGQVMSFDRGFDSAAGIERIC